MSKDYKRDLIMRRAELLGQKAYFTEKEEFKALTIRENDALTEITRSLEKVDADLARADNGRIQSPPDAGSRQIGSEASATKSPKSGKHNDRVEGRKAEVLDSKMTATEWVRRASANGMECETGWGTSSQRTARMTNPASFNENEYWGQRLGFTRNGAELRTLTEDTAGSGQAITPQSWSAQVIDYCYPLSLLGRLGASVVPMTTEQVNLAQFTAPVQPVWIAEAGATSLDANPAFSPVPLIAKGAFYDITLYSMQLAQDAYISGDLPGFLAQSAARNYAVAMDQAGFYGVSGNSGCVGFSNTAGIQLRKWGAGGATTNAPHAGTTGQAPADTQEPSTQIEMVRAKNIEPSGYATSPQLVGTLARINVPSYAKFFELPTDAANLWANHTVFSTAIPTIETDPAGGVVPAQTGGTMTSLYCADWSRVVIGMHLDMQTIVLKERYADQLEFGLLTFMRFCVVLTHPEGMVRSTGALTT